MSTDISKRILFLDAYYEPEKTAYSHLEHDLVEMLVSHGFDITIICPQPTRAVTKKEHKNFIKEENAFDGHVLIKRFKCFGERKTVILRAIRYFVAYVKTFAFAKRENDVDVIFCNSTPPIQGLLAAKLKLYYLKKHNRNVPFVYNLQDLFPDSMVNAGIANKKSFVYKVGNKITKKVYQNANQIITISNSFREELIKRGVDENKISVVYNWIDLEKVKPIERSNNPLFDKLCIKRDDRIVCYAGNFGYAQDLDAIVKLANCFENESLIFIVFGGGSLFDVYSQKMNCMKNVFVFPLMPQSMISYVYSLADIYLISCKKGLGDSSFPSKIWSILACNKFVVGLFDEDSEVAHFLEDNNCGQVVNQDDVNRQLDAIKNGLSAKGDFRFVAQKYGNKENATYCYLNAFLNCFDK